VRTATSFGVAVVVPPEYREAGCPPASWFIHDLMRFLGQPYYVALLTAAAIHGAAHQQRSPRTRAGRADA
jgi:hypothetical protein